MMTRRELLALAGVAALAGCGTRSAGAAGSVGQAGSDVARAAASPGARALAAEAVTAFGADLYGAIATPDAGNLVCSPYSVAVALGMTVQGARGRTAREMLDVLHVEDAAALASGLNGIDAQLATRSGTIEVPGLTPQRLDLAMANSLWGQRDYPWRQAFLDVLAREFGTGLRTVDYVTAAEGARKAINGWVSERTRERVPELVPPGVLDEFTRLVLVNAIWFKASWREAFMAAGTSRQPFHRLDGSSVDADLMRDAFADVGYAAGDGWQAADLPYGDGKVAMAVVVPEAGRFADVERSMGVWLPRVVGGLTPEPVEVVLPRWTSRTAARLDRALSRLGMPAAFSPTEADFSGMADSDETLVIGAVLHEGFIAVDEKGTEAAAATAVEVQAVSGLAPQRSVVADRPFLYVIHDLPTRTPLFVGRVLDPS
jgi:serine protease inhibitor